MFGRVFPKQFDNDYRGAQAAIWLFVPLIFMKFMMGFNSIFFTRMASSADGVDLTALGPKAAAVVVSLYAPLGLSLALLALIGVAALVCYRSMIPFLYLVLLVQQLAGKALGLWRPSARSDLAGSQTATGFVLIALGVTLVGFILSLWSPAGRGPELAAGGSR